MAISYIGQASASGAGVTSLSCNLAAGTQPGDIFVMVYAFEGVAAGSGPWIIPNIGQYASNNVGPYGGYLQACWQSPKATGIGLEVWVAILSSASPFVANFAAAQNVTVVTTTYRGEYNPTSTITGGPPRLAPSAQVVGNQPAAPSVAANAGELVVACGADAMTGAGFGTPSGFTNRVDVARAGAGTAEATIADTILAAAVTTGPITFPNAAASSSQNGATATLVIVPAPTATGAGPVLDVAMPPDLDLGDGWTLRVTALDPVTGAVVTGVRVSNLALEVALGEGTSASDIAVGPYLLVPGAGA
jgi:hypothetical protein